MHIVVCVQQIIDSGVSLQVDEVAGVVVQAEPKQVYLLNLADRSALEAALGLVTGAPSVDRVTVLTLGPIEDEGALRYCLARGATEAIRVWDKLLEGIDPFLTAQVLSRALLTLDPDLVFCGSRSTVGATAQVPATLAELLCLPQLTGVVDVELVGGGLRVQRRLERGNRVVLEGHLPALVAVEAGSFPGRYVSWNAQLRSRQSIRCLGLSDIGLLPSDVAPDRYFTRITKLTPPRPRTKKTPTPAASGADMMAILMGGGTTVRKSSGSQLLEGQPEHVAAEMVKFLQEKGFLHIG